MAEEHISVYVDRHDAEMASLPWSVILEVADELYISNRSYRDKDQALQAARLAADALNVAVEEST